MTRLRNEGCQNYLKRKELKMYIQPEENPFDLVFLPPVYEWL